MPLIEEKSAFTRYLKDGRNSSHFVWFLAGLKYFQSSNQWIFGYKQVGDVTLFALEPLIPGAPTEYTLEHEQQFLAAWGELCAELDPKVCCFTAVYEPFLQLLHKGGFQSVKIGTEPWVCLDNCIPSGNAGKGVRWGRNQALRAGLKVEEWSCAEISGDAAKRKAMEALFDAWRSRNPVDLRGFLNACDPFAHMEVRRYFVLKDKEDRLQAYLIATPVPGIKSYFLEDLVMHPAAPCGAGELITLEAMVTLNTDAEASGHRMASLGVVACTTMNEAETRGLPKLINFLMLKLPGYLCKVYNYAGLETFRSRFKPEYWQSVHLAVFNRRPGYISDTGAWVMSLAALLKAFKPTLKLSWGWVRHRLLRPFKRHPISLFILTTSFLVFWLVNGFGEIPVWAIRDLGYRGSAPFWQWPLRSISSDYLYFNLSHILLCCPAYFLFVWWAEERSKLSFLLPFFAAISLFSDSVFNVFVLKPFYFISPGIYTRMAELQDVGGSLVMMAFIGLMIAEFRKLRDIILPVFALAVLFVLVFTNTRFHSLVLNLNHLLFLVIGYLTGRVKQELYKRRSQRAARCKPPSARCVAQPALRLSKTVRPSAAIITNSPAELNAEAARPTATGPNSDPRQ